MKRGYLVVFHGALLAALGGAGCLGTGGARGAPSRPIAEFPTQQTVARLGATPVTPPPVTTGAVPPDGWTVQVSQPEVLPSFDDTWQPQTPWDHEMANAMVAAQRKSRPSRALACFAREIGRYHLAHGVLPPDNLNQFMLAACGAFTPQVGSNWLTYTVPAAVPDSRLLETARGDLRTKLLDQVPATAQEVGFWFGRAANGAIAIMAHSIPMAELATRNFQPNAQGDVVLEGKLLGASDGIFGYVNQRRFGVEACLIDPSVARPRFRATCHLAPEDTSAWVQLYYTPPRRVLATPFVQVLARRQADVPLVYKEEAGNGARPVGSVGDFCPAVLAELNTVRAQAGLRPVQLASEQSTTAARLAGRYFAAAAVPGNATAEEMDQIALGLMAGWQVPGMIRDGRFVSSTATHTLDAARWLSSTLELPMGRATMLSPEIEQIALGPLVMSQPHALGAIVAGWQLHHGNDHVDDVRRLYLRLLEARRRLGKNIPSRLAGMEPVLRQILQRVHDGQERPTGALNSALHVGVDRFGRNMRGYVIETMSLDALEIPEEVVKQSTLHLEIGVTHHKPPGAAWGQLVIVVIYLDYSGGAVEARNGNSSTDGVAGWATGRNGAQRLALTPSSTVDTIQH